MKIIKPTSISSAMVIANSASNTDAEYDPAATYAAQQKCTFAGYVYLSLQATNTGKQPDLLTSAAWWSLVGAANKWAMFDDEVQTQTSASASLSATISVSYVDSIALLNLTGSSVRVSVKKEGVTIYDKTVDLLDHALVENFNDFFFSTREYQSELALTDLPALPDVEITVAVSKIGATVGIGLLVLGRVFDVGLEQYGLKREGVDYTIATFDKFGKLKREKQAYARKYSTQVNLDNARFDTVSKRLDSIASTPVVCVGGNGWKSTLTVYGLITYSINLATCTTSFVSIDVKGLI